MKFLSILTYICLLIGSIASAFAQTDSVDRKLRHVVLFSFLESSSATDIVAIETAFEALPTKIPEIIDFEWGLNNSPEGLNKDFTHCFLVTFADEAGRAAYLPHPEHLAFVDLLKPHLKDVLVVDYWAE